MDRKSLVMNRVMANNTYNIPFYVDINLFEAKEVLYNG